VYQTQIATRENVGDLLENVHNEELTIHRKYAPWVSFKTSNLKVIDEGRAYSLINPEGLCIALFGIQEFEDSRYGMWCIPRKGMSTRDNVAFLRLAVKKVDEWAKEFGDIYVPVHDSWPAVKELVLFLGFDILPGEQVAVYGGDHDDY
jgi:hypothetical protein